MSQDPHGVPRVIADHEFRRSVSWKVYSRIEVYDHLDVAFEITVFIHKSPEICVVIRLEKYQHEINILFCFYFLEDIEYEILGGMTVASPVPKKV